MTTPVGSDLAAPHESTSAFECGSVVSFIIPLSTVNEALSC